MCALRQVDAADHGWEVAPGSRRSTKPHSGRGIRGRTRAEPPLWSAPESDVAALAECRTGRSVRADGPALRTVVVDVQVIARLQDRKLCASTMRDHVGMEVRRGDGSVIAVEVAGGRDAAPGLVCPGLADSRLSACWFAPAAGSRPRSGGNK